MSDQQKVMHLQIQPKSPYGSSRADKEILDTLTLLRDKFGFDIDMSSIYKRMCDFCQAEMNPKEAGTGYLCDYCEYWYDKCTNCLVSHRENACQREVCQEKWNHDHAH